MTKYLKMALSAALPGLLAAGCSDFLKGGELTNSPNNPVVGSASADQLFRAVQVNNYAYQSSEVARSIAMWMQEIVGVQRQQFSVYNYSISTSTFDGDFSLPYGGGGLLDLRAVDTLTIAGPNLRLRGAAQLIEGWMLGTTADMWGAIPYAQAADLVAFPLPAFDPESAVYVHVEAVLDTAITNLGAVGGANSIAGSDQNYGGSAARWIALAHTLKARFYLHQAEQRGAAMYDSVLNHTTCGACLTSSAGDYLLRVTDATIFETNLWWQFLDANGSTGRAGDIIADNSFLWTLLVDSVGGGGTVAAPVDPRFNEYFDINNGNDGEFKGPNAGNGFDPTLRMGDAYAQPFVTYQEVLLMQAEANLMKTVPNVAAATAALDAELAEWGTANAWHNAITLPPSGGATLANVMTEKYITLFQNIEVWNDWKRTCIPVLASVSPPTPIPSRLPYGVTEIQTNGGNIPATGLRNWNDPNPCP